MSLCQDSALLSVIVTGCSLKVPCAQLGRQLSTSASPRPVAGTAPQLLQVTSLAHKLPSPDIYRTDGSYFGVAAPVQPSASDWQSKNLAGGTLPVAAADVVQPARTPQSMRTDPIAHDGRASPGWHPLSELILPSCPCGPLRASQPAFRRIPDRNEQPRSAATTAVCRAAAYIRPPAEPPLLPPRSTRAGTGHENLRAARARSRPDRRGQGHVLAERSYPRRLPAGADRQLNARGQCLVVSADLAATRPAGFGQAKVWEPKVQRSNGRPRRRRDLAAGASHKCLSGWIAADCLSAPSHRVLALPGEMPI